MDDRVTRFREITDARRGEFFRSGCPERYFFPHRLYYIPKCGPDGLKVARRIRQIDDPSQLWQVNLYVVPPLLDQFPPDVYFDDDIMWHQQQLGIPGQLAAADLLIDGKSLYATNHHSDLVQRISRRRDLKTGIEKKFKGWHLMLLNGILNFAAENKLVRVYSPTADLVVELSDPKRKATLQRELFDRLYDRDVKMLYRAVQENGWWVIDVAENKHGLITPKQSQVTEQAEKTICLMHDIEKGLGHVGIDPDLERFANENASRFLEEMLAVEREGELRTTYNVVGVLLNEVRGQIERDGHCIAFHSYDHRMTHKRTVARAPLAPNYTRRMWRKLQGSASTVSRLLFIGKMLRKVRTARLSSMFEHPLEKCRQVDYRIKGYRAPMSMITAELADPDLCFYNFEWLASSRASLGIDSPVLQNRIVKIPVLFDDFALYKLGMDYARWEDKVIQLIEESDFAAIGLHDCYAQVLATALPNFSQKNPIAREFQNTRPGCQ